MSVIIQQPDTLSFSGNLKPFLITSSVEVLFQLYQGTVLVLSEKYQPLANNLLTIDLKAIIDKLLSITLPGSALITDQTTGYDDFTANIDSLTSIFFRVIKGGVFEIDELASVFVDNHFLTWQIQDKRILQHQPEWLTVYTNGIRNFKATAYYLDGTDATILLTTLEAEKLLAVDVSWASINALFIKKNPIAWDVWFEDIAGTRLSYIQRYCLHNPDQEERIFIWANTLGGIDTITFTGSAEDDRKLEHQIAEYTDESLSQYQIDKKREIKQSTGYLTIEEKRWVEDFFYSQRRFYIDVDGVIRAIVIASSKLVDSTADDLFDYEFSYRLTSDSQLLNLDRVYSPLPVVEVPADFFLTELLAGLPVALYLDNLLMAVQSPFAQVWQKLSLSQLFFGALSSMVDGHTIKLLDGKLAVSGIGGIDAVALQELRDYIDSLISINVNDTRTELLSGAILWRIGLTYDSSIIIYKIFGTKYKANAGVFTLYSDPNFSMFFTFFVDMFANLNFVAGIASANPTKPILLSTQLEVMTVLVGPGALEPSNIDVSVVYKENDPLTEWTASLPEVIDEYIDIDFNSTNVPLTGDKCIYIKIAVPDSATNAPKHYIGEKYQGGIIFWLSADGKHGLICAAEDTATGVWFASLSGGGQSTGGRGTAIGTGQANTAAMLLQGKTKDHAVRYCDQLVIDGYSDFFMPSQDETLEMYFRRFEIGGLANKTYWTSTEANYQDGIAVSFANGVADNWDKNRRMEVRAIRKFDDNVLPNNVPVPTYTPTTAIMKFATPTPVSVSNGILSLNIKSSIDWQFNSMLLFESYLGNVKTGSVAMSATTNLFNYKPGNDSWQLIVLQMYQFAPIKGTLDNFRISLVGAWTNNLELSIDDVRFQHSDIIVAEATAETVQKTDYHFNETPDGIRTEFTTSLPYIPGTTKITLDGCIRLFPGDDEDYIERDGKIIFAEAPDADAGLICDYETLKN